MVETACHRQGMKFIHKSQPFPWSEDFGYFTREFRGAMFALGAGQHHAPLHNEDFDFPDEITPRAFPQLNHALLMIMPLYGSGCGRLLGDPPADRHCGRRIDGCPDTMHVHVTVVVCMCDKSNPS